MEHRDTVIFGSLFNHQIDAQAARRDAVALALELINEGGGLDTIDATTGQVTRRPLGLVSCNIGRDASRSTAEAAVDAADYLTGVLGVPALLGPASSGDVRAVYEFIREQGRDVFIGAPSATSDELIGIDGPNPTDDAPGLLWRTAPSDASQRAAIVADLNSRASSFVAIIAQTGSYGEGLSTGLGGSLNMRSRLFKFDTESAGQLENAIADVGESDAQEVLFIASSLNDVVTFLAAAAESPRYATRQFFLTDSAATKDMLARTPPILFDRIRGTRPAIDESNPVYVDFDADYRRRFRVCSDAYNYTAHAFDMTWIAALGAAWVRSHDPQAAITGSAIARGARNLSLGPALDLVSASWKAAIDSFSLGQGIDIHGASGPLDYDPDTEETTGAIEVWTIDTTTSPPRIVAAPSPRTGLVGASQPALEVVAAQAIEGETDCE